MFGDQELTVWNLFSGSLSDLIHSIDSFHYTSELFFCWSTSACRRALDAFLIMCGIYLLLDIDIIQFYILYSAVLFDLLYCLKVSIVNCLGPKLSVQTL